MQKYCQYSYNSSCKLIFINTFMLNQRTNNFIIVLMLNKLCIYVVLLRYVLDI